MLKYGTVSQQALNVPVTADPFYNDVVLLVEGEGVDGSTVFTDHSLYGHDMTALGIVNDTDVDVEGTPSLLSDSDEDRLQANTSGEHTIRPTTPDFCLEMYARFTDVGDVQRLIARRDPSIGCNWGWYISGTDLGFAFWRSGGAQETQFTVAHGMSTNTVYHLACIRQGETYYMFRDGVLLGSATPTPITVAGFNNFPLTIGHSDTEFTNRHIRGNVNHVRVTIGNARYNVAGFVPDPAPFFKQGPERVPTPVIPNDSTKTAHLVANETLVGAEALPNMAGTKVAGFGVNGAAVSTAQAKWGTQSLRLESGDFLEVHDGEDTGLSLTDFNDPTVSKSLSFWIRPDALSGTQTICSRNNNTLEDDITLRLESTGQMRLILQNAGDVVFDMTTSKTRTMSAETWHHVALQVRGSDESYALFLDGRLVGRATMLGNVGVNATANQDPLNFGRDDNNTGLSFAGYLDEIIIHEGVLFEDDFEVPTAPQAYSARPAAPNPTFASVGLLVGFDGADGSTTFTDESSYAATASVGGDPEVDTAFSKFGGGSGLFDASGDELEFAHNADVTVGNGLLTVEAWFRPDAAALARATSHLVSKRTGSGNEYRLTLQGGKPEWIVWKSGTNVVIRPDITIQADTWHHMVGVRDGNMHLLYLNGYLIGGDHNRSGNATNTANVNIGQDKTTGSRGWSGHIDEVRVTGENFYPTSGFIPPTAAFPRS